MRPAERLVVAQLACEGGGVAVNQPGLQISKYACSEQHSLVARRRGVPVPAEVPGDKDPEWGRGVLIGGSHAIACAAVRPAGAATCFAAAAKALSSSWCPGGAVFDLHVLWRLLSRTRGRVIAGHSLVPPSAHAGPAVGATQPLLAAPA